MEYTFKRTNDKGVFNIKRNEKSYVFVLDITPSNFESLGIEPTEEMIAEEAKRASESKVLLEIFSSNESEAEKFADMISSDPNKGYANYIEVAKINEILNQLK